ncbi:MAG: CHAT domain-containing protein [Oculatellaceae cyanobacterium bins.114]|nr:CHAT domain-containing protein [Oculatellaceae cyanobacterium bins.114]
MTRKSQTKPHVYTLKAYVALAVLTAVLCVLVSATGGWSMNAPDAPHPSQNREDAIAQTPPDALAQGRSLYEAEQYVAAAEVLEQAVETYRSQGNALQEAIALSNLSLVYQQLGRWSEAETAIATSLERLQTSNSTNRAAIEAQILDVQGRLQLSQGQAETALSTWERVEELYQRAGNLNGVTRATINQAEALQTLGLYRRAIATLEELTSVEQPDSDEQVVALRSLGDALRVTGDLTASQQALEQSLAMAERLQLPRAIAATQFSLGNTAYAQAQRQSEQARNARRRSDATEAEQAIALAQQRQTEALAFYQHVAPNASPIVQTQALLNQLRLLIEAERWSEAEALVPQITTQLDRLPASRTAIYARVNFAQSLAQLDNRESPVIREPDVLPAVRPPQAATSPTVSTVAAQQLAIAVQQAQTLQDRRAQAFAIGNLGSLYEKTGQLTEAQRLSAQALDLSQRTSAADVSYLWQWQLGRILKAQGDRKGAIAAYSDAVRTLQTLRSDLVAVSLEVQFSFRETIEPIHRELVSLLLQPDVEPTQVELEQARKTIESLQLAELDNFFREACLNARQVEIDEVDRQAAVIYPIILSDRIEVILSLPAGADTQASALVRTQTKQQAEEIPATPLRHYSTPISKSQVEMKVGELRQYLRQATAARRAQPLAQEVYNWLIRPVADELKASGAKTLVFVPDGVLRNIPMSALYDGERFLIEDYAVALTPGLQLLEAQSIQTQQLTVLMAGVSQAQQNFPGLPGVINEFQAIRTKIPTSQVLLNQDFTTDNFQTAINQVPYPIVHLATHGEFSSQPEDTFILTWQNRINIQQLSRLLQATDVSRRRPIELLVLSACKTAEGDDRAALGLAGVAVRAGARSTVATLWSFDDQAASLIMDRFYQELASAKVTKAEALRQAQLALLQNPQYRRPYFWSPVVLVGNWQ